jgi:hypothetical protein
MNVSLDTVAAIIADLDAAQPPRLSVRDAIAGMAAHIRAARERGCPDDQILGILARHEIAITAGTLRSYLSKTAPKTRPPRKAAALAATKALAEAGGAGGAAEAPAPAG